VQLWFKAPAAKIYLLAVLAKLVNIDQQVVETKIKEVMHTRPRTCSSDIKAIDAMLVSVATFHKA